MNHLGNTNKMVDTPRTDAAYIASTGAGIYELFKESQDIERELNAANSEIKRLTAKVAQLYEGAEEQRKLIKRLEEAGDGLSMWVCPEYKSDPANIALIEWNKAKEAKL